MTVAMGYGARFVSMVSLLRSAPTLPPPPPSRHRHLVPLLALLDGVGQVGLPVSNALLRDGALVRVRFMEEPSACRQFSGSFSYP